MPRVFLATLILLLATGLTASRIGNVEGHQAERAIGWERNVAASVALASDDPVIVRPVAPATVDSGSQFQVVIEASNVEGLAGAQLVLTYDDSLLTFVSAQVGDDIAAAGSTCIALSNNDEQGLHLASACAAEDFQGFSGAPLVLWTVTFEAGGAAADTDTDIEVADEDLSLIDAASPPGDIPSIGERDTLTILAPEFIRVLFAFEGGARPKPDGWQKPVTVKFFVLP